jgi:2-enoate reductase
MVAIGKGLLTDPFWVRRLEQGRTEEIRPCIGCHDGCTGRISKGKPLSCAVNPAAGRERSYQLVPAYKSSKVVVVGGGPAGMEAARVGALRGHRVILYEKESSLGGHLREASVPEFKRDLLRYLDWCKRELSTLDVDIRTGCEATADLVLKEDPNVTIIATGSKPIIPELPGLEKEIIVGAMDLLLGRKRAGRNVLVLGGGLIGCETALWLAQQGKKVVISEILKDVLSSGIPVQHMNRLMLLDLLRFHGVEINTSISSLEAAEGGVLLLNGNFQKKFAQADTIVIAVGMKSQQDLYSALRAELPNLFLIGDSRIPQNVMNAVWDAYEVSRMI